MENIESLPLGSYLKNGKYKITGILGQGGFGITYKAVTMATIEGNLDGMDVEVNVAIKEFFMKDLCMRDELSSAVTISTSSNAVQVDQYRRKFVKEARNIASLKHPHIVHVSEIFEEKNTIYYVMQYLSGGSLKDYVNQQPDGRLSEDEAMKYILNIANALQYMHNNKHMCHFDVKPGNILLHHNNAILIDFGISKSYDTSGHETSSTPAGISKGFAPMEQYSPQTLKDFSPQSDIYALGATYYYCLTGKVPSGPSDILNYGFPQCPLYVSNRAWLAICKAMQPACNVRPKDVQEFVSMITLEKAVPNSDDNKCDDATSIKQKNDSEVYFNDEVIPILPKSKSITKSKYVKWIIILIVAIITVLLLVDNFLTGKNSSPETENNLTKIHDVD